MMGRGYFINCDLLLSLWFFHLFYLAEQAFFMRVGIDTGLSSDLWTSTGATSTVAHQQFGALIVLAIYSLWLARGEFKDPSNRIYLIMFLSLSIILSVFFRLVGIPFFLGY